jgi:hypothetical protein
LSKSQVTGRLKGVEFEKVSQAIENLT